MTITNMLFMIMFVLFIFVVDLTNHEEDKQEETRYKITWVSNEQIINK